MAATSQQQPRPTQPLGNQTIPDASAAALVDFIRASVIGADETATGPFGPMPVIYADYVASGRALSFIENYLLSEVLPRYANTHTESSGTGRQTSSFRHEARAIIAECMGATSEHAVIFTGSGSTSAINKLIDVMGLRIPSALEDMYRLSRFVTERPVIFIGPYEHHSNELPWRESVADVVTIREDANGLIDLEHLESELEGHARHQHLIGSFSAASNVTGIRSDTRAVSSLLHRHGALAFWDFAAAAPYVSVDMGSKATDDYFDAVFVSPHKFIGGPGTPGLLVARRELFTNRVPTVPGGGTVAYVNSERHTYLDDIEMREEGGTPDILGSIRAGLVFQLQAAVGTNEIQRREEQFLTKAMQSWSEEPRIEVLGAPAADRLSVLSFVIRADGGPAGTTRFLHHNFVVAVLNDLFGIQSRGGCSCAGPYGHRLLGIDTNLSESFEREIHRGCEGIKPGWTRVSLNYFASDDEIDYIIEAIRLIARRGQVLLPLYRFEPDTGLWRHRELPSNDGVLSLHDIDYATGSMVYDPRPISADGSLSEHLAWATHLLEQLVETPVAPLERPETNSDFEHVRWFPYPAEYDTRAADES